MPSIMHGSSGFHLLGGAGGIFPHKPLIFPPKHSPSSVCTSFLAAVNPKVVQICQYKVSTKWVWSINGVLPPQTKDETLQLYYVSVALLTRLSIVSAVYSVEEPRPSPLIPELEALIKLIAPCICLM